MTPNTSEYKIQQNTILLLTAMGWQFISREDNLALRGNRTTEVLLRDILLSQLDKINSYEYQGVRHKFSLKNIECAIAELDVLLNEELNIANQKITDKLVLGDSYDEELGDGCKKSFSMRYIDFDNIANNVFHFTEEFSVSRNITTETDKTRRPDLVLFINGIPYAVIELKKSSVNIDEGISQMIRNQKTEEIPHLFKYVQITVAGNNFNPKYATTNTPIKFYASWEEDNINAVSNIISNRTVSKLDQTIFSLFDIYRTLELFRLFILFDKKDKRLIKKIARYQQYFAIQKILHKINNITQDGSRSGGLVWHTQGSGKSLTMVMLTKALKQYIPGSRVVVVTDRKDLDIQIHNTFSNTEIVATRAINGRDLLEQLQSGKSVITTLIHKFEMVKNEGVIISDADVFILVDESHRTQGGDLHKAMKKVFPLGCYLGFTGTPLLKTEKSSIMKFGGLIHRYTIDEAVRDKTVLPLLYEGRLVHQWVCDKNGLDHRFEVIAKNLNDTQRLDLEQKWARFSRVASSERRLEMIAFDINQHYTHNVQGTGLKGILATNSKYEAIKYHELFKEYGNIKTAFVISASDTRDGYDNVDEDNKNYAAKAWIKILKDYGTEEYFLSSIQDKFINGDDVELLIVVDKLLTGFDAPCATILYIDKELKEHNLLQAIARVNRVHDGKDVGFIIDYRGLLGNLDQALSSYSALAGFDEDDLMSAVIDIKTEISKVQSLYKDLERLFVSITNKEDEESYQVFLADKKLRQQFYELLSLYARALKIALSSDKIDEVLTDVEILQYKKAMKRYSNLRQALKIRYHEAVDFGKYEKDMQKLLDTFISADGVNQLTKLVNIFDEDFDKELMRLVGDNARADSILNATEKVITEKHQENPQFYTTLSVQITSIIENYHNGRLSDEEKLKHAKDVRELLTQKHINTDKHYPREIKNNEFAKTLYDNVGTVFQGANISEDESIQFILKIDDIFKQFLKKPNWQYNIDVINEIDQLIDDILYDFSNTIKENVVDEIKTIRQIGISHYAK